MSTDLTTKKNEDGLTERQARLVELMANGSVTINDVWAEAGYSAVQGARAAWAQPHVREAFFAICRSRLIDQIPEAITVRGNLLKSKSDYVRLEAVKDILDRSGLRPDAEGETRVGAINIQINV